jgi:hypothetical protein
MRRFVQNVQIGQVWRGLGFADSVKWALPFPYNAPAVGGESLPSSRTALSPHPLLQTLLLGSEANEASALVR